MINCHKEIFEDRTWNNHKSDPDFKKNWFNHENRRYYEETVYNHFCI